MEALSESFIFYKADRFDIVGKQLLKTNSKWFIVDFGLSGYILPWQRYVLGFSIVNIVYFEPVSYTHLDVYKRQEQGMYTSPCSGWPARYILPSVIKSCPARCGIIA